MEERHLASFWQEGLARVLGTPMLVALCKEACRLAVDPHLPEGFFTVGSCMSLRHMAHTPQGMDVWAQARLTAIEGRILRFVVRAWDELEEIGQAEHERAVINTSKFMEKVKRKALGLS